MTIFTPATDESTATNTSTPVFAPPTTERANTVDEIGVHPDDGEAQARFDALFRAHQPRLVRALTLVAGDGELAADAVQEAFTKAHLRWRRVSRYDDPIGWVRRVAINRLRDEHRRTRRKRAAVERLGSHPVGYDETALPDHDLRRRIAALPRQQRLCLVLHHLEDLSVAQVAETLGVAEGTVKSNLSDARAALRAQLTPPTEDLR